MKSKYELSISSKYVKDWTYLEAVREFFQNAIDESRSNSNHKMNYNYDSENQILTIENFNTKLDVSTLLLGETSKSNGNSIGSFGEGYKIGILVLLREGKSVTIMNGPDQWTTRLVKSKRYNSEIPVIEIQKNYDRSNNNLTVIIEGITEEEYDSIKNNNLIIKNDESSDDRKEIDTDYGTLLMSDEEKGRVYVGGLFVCEDFELKYGYNINPKHIQLNRDRNMISSFDLIWNTSRIIANALYNDPEKLYHSLKCKDTNYIDSFLKSNSKDDLVRFFSEKYGDRIPVSTQEEFNYFSDKGMNPVIVEEKVKVIISSGCSTYSSSYKEYDSSGSLYERLNELLKELESHVTSDGKKLLTEINNYVEDYKDDLSEIKCE